MSSCKGSGGDGIPAELYQILKDDAVKVLHSIYQQIWKTQQWPQAKGSSNYHTIALISHASKVMLRIPQARLQEYMNQELPDIELDFEEIDEPEIKVPTFIVSWGKQRNSITHLLLLH